MKLIRYGIPLLAAASLGFGAATTVILEPAEQLPTPANPPAVTTLGPSTVAGLGTVEPRQRRVNIGTPVSGVVAWVFVEPGQSVLGGQPLLALDDRELQAELQVRKATLAVEHARLERLRRGPRPEDLPAARAKVTAARVAVERHTDLFERGRMLSHAHAISVEEQNIRKFNLREAEAALAQAEAELQRLEAGTWSADLAVAEQEVSASRAAVRRVETEIERLTVRAPVDALVLQVDIRQGEFATAGALPNPLVTLGPRGALEVRVQIDEEDAGRVQAGQEAEGYVRGRVRARVPLQFLRIEPQVVPKTTLTGSTLERVDTRVLFVVYQVTTQASGASDSPTLYPGQLLDVFIRSPQTPALEPPVARTSHAG